MSKNFRNYTPPKNESKTPSVYDSEKLTQWYEENNEAILFGRYLRVNENDRWRFWHDKWVNDPGLKEDMSDYFQMEEWKDKRKK